MAGLPGKERRLGFFCGCAPVNHKHILIGFDLCDENIPLPWWEGLGEGGRRFHPLLTSPIKGEGRDHTGKNLSGLHNKEETP